MIRLLHHQVASGCRSARGVKTTVPDNRPIVPKTGANRQSSMSGTSTSRIARIKYAYKGSVDSATYTHKACSMIKTSPFGPHPCIGKKPTSLTITHRKFENVTWTFNLRKPQLMNPGPRATPLRLANEASSLLSQALNQAACYLNRLILVLALVFYLGDNQPTLSAFYIFTLMQQCAFSFLLKQTWNANRQCNLFPVSCLFVFHIQLTLLFFV